MARATAHQLQTVLAVTASFSLFLTGCETVSGTIFPDSPKSPASAGTPPTVVAAPQAGTSQFLPVSVSPGAPSGTSAGAAIEGVRNNLVRLQGQLSGRNVALAGVRQSWTQDVAAYRTQKNQVLRPPPQANVRAALSQGDAVLTRLSGHTGRLSREMEAFAQGNADANALMTRLDALSPEADADREQLNVLREEVMKTSGALDLLVNSLSSEAGQNNAFIAKERASLASLGQQAASVPSVRATTAPTTPPGPSVAPLSAAAGTPKPPAAAAKPAFVTIKFDRPSVTYREALQAALKQALLRRPDASFDVVGVTSDGSQEAQDLVKARAEDVSRTMMELGVPATKIGIDSLRAKTASDEVRIFVR